MDTGNIDQPAICQECGVTTTLDSVQQICWECWLIVAEKIELEEKVLVRTEEEQTSLYSCVYTCVHGEQVHEGEGEWPMGYETDRRLHF